MGPSRALMRWRGAARHCPRCGSGHLFRGWFRMVLGCPRCCGLHFEREQGYWSGALAVNMLLTGALFMIVFGVTLALTLPDVPVVPLLALVVPVMVLGPLVLYPVSKTLGVAVDRAFLQRLDRAEQQDEQMRHI